MNMNAFNQNPHLSHSQMYKNKAFLSFFINLKQKNVFWLCKSCMDAAVSCFFDNNSLVELTDRALSLTVDATWTRIHHSKSFYTEMNNNSRVITVKPVYIPLSLLLLLTGGEPIAVYSRLPRSVPADLRPAFPRAVANTGLEGRFREEHNSLRSEERNCLWD